MRSAPSLWEKCPTLVRCSRLAVACAFGWAAGCSVYTSELVETTTGITAGGTEASGGKQNGAAGNSSNLGGKVAVDPSGGEGGEEPTDTPNGGKAGETAGGAGSGAGGTAGTDPVGGGTAGSGGLSAGGTAGVAGSAGTGGTAAGTGDLLDGFEDDDLTLEQTDGRGGVWYLVGDGTTGTVAPSPLVCTPNSGAPVDLGGFAMHITATGFTGSGSLLGADLRNTKLVYNGSKFTGIRFWAKVGAGTGKNKTHRVQLSDSTTDAAGGKCVPASTVATEKCDDHFGKSMTFTTEWKQYSITFAEMTQLGWGKSAAAINKAALYGFQVTAKPKLDVDLWLDQIEFF
ncbi:MAG TPA: hypothetical protein VHP33_05595 [Polyangiaceae bacterium]|nr:hypothetical protein [Polyangiaceae bacterium]